MQQKFRAWDKETQTMNGMAEIYRNKKQEIELHPRDEHIILMQSTGLFDKNGQEIFEGDVILWSYWDEFEDSGRAKIIFDKGMFKLLDIRTGKEVWDNLFDCLENCDVYFQGNIYENPELLEGI
jgi:uncharacterized phage protein (TIGR01671 family)